MCLLLILSFLLHATCLSATGGLLISSAPKDPTSLETTIDNMMNSSGLNLTDDQVGVIKTIMTKNLHPQSVHHLLSSFMEEVPTNQKNQFRDVANRLVGLYYKKSKIMDKIIQTLSNGTDDANTMRHYMSNMTVNAILDTVNKTYNGVPEWETISDYVHQMKDDPHGRAHMKDPNMDHKENNQTVHPNVVNNNTLPSTTLGHLLNPTTVATLVKNSSTPAVIVSVTTVNLPTNITTVAPVSHNSNATHSNATTHPAVAETSTTPASDSSTTEAAANTKGSETTQSGTESTQAAEKSTASPKSEATHGTEIITSANAHTTVLPTHANSTSSSTNSTITTHAPILSTAASTLASSTKLANSPVLNPTNATAMDEKSSSNSTELMGSLEGAEDSEGSGDTDEGSGEGSGVMAEEAHTSGAMVAEGSGETSATESSSSTTVQFIQIQKEREKLQSA